MKPQCISSLAFLLQFYELTDQQGYSSINLIVISLYLSFLKFLLRNLGGIINFVDNTTT